MSGPASRLTDPNAHAASLRQQITTCENTLRDLRAQLAALESAPTPSSLSLESNGTKKTAHVNYSGENGEDDGHASISEKSPMAPPGPWPLTPAEYRRYGRQLILPEIGLPGQLALRRARVLIVGAGGLGCPAALYLAGAGVGTLGLADGDVVEESNLHRQVLHAWERVGAKKVDSAAEGIRALNPSVVCVPHYSHLDAATALDVVAGYDVVLDCTDTPASRYLVSDVCVLLGRPLVTAAALRTEGQLMVLNDPARPPADASGGPCYRCVFPRPPPAESVVGCGEGGVLGPVVGVMGVLQALEAIKIITRGAKGISDLELRGRGVGVYTNGTEGVMQEQKPESPSMLLFSAYPSTQFRSVRLRPRRKDCAACSSAATVTAKSLRSGSLDYVRFCGTVPPMDSLSLSERVSAEYFKALLSGPEFAGGGNHVLVDTRDSTQFGICSLPGSLNIPFSEIDAYQSDGHGSGDMGWAERLRELSGRKPIYVICRYGNDSQLAVRKMKGLGLSLGGQRWIGDIRGGLKAWRDAVDSDFPEY